MHTITIQTPKGEKRSFSASHFPSYEVAYEAFTQIHSRSIKELGWEVLPRPEKSSGTETNTKET